ncbi:Dolichyl-phosphate-mannose--protein mannosyltransferase 4 [Rhodotorula toruloides]|uniref:Dolichyl-phosphate-mannose--protein mannosyltransferase n=2 Tax=Rhodotorula toruloides TaxID=5286 RepID=A0A2T0AFD7_RHOTO|nr:Dolichyl-phosphate-mannose-protein mannosyltransferase-domain containing protein [Rhodotorula toruloides]
MQATASSQPDRLLLHRSRAAAPSPSPGSDSTTPARAVSPSHDPRLDKRSDDWNADVTGQAGQAGTQGSGKGYLLDKGAEEEPPSSNRTDYIVLLGVFLLAAALRFYRIDHPSGVVFDEVHFGKFASYYLRREFFFDVHPPLAKLLLAFQGWLIGYDGSFEFENIGDSYLDAKVPYVGLRTLPALLGSAIPAVVYAIMRESGYPRVVGLFSACLVLFDNAHIAQTRLILLDAPMILFMALAFYAYIRFYKLRYSEFTRPWWTWMTLTGIFLSLTISCKMVGLFAFLAVGSAVVYDLWNILDVRRGLTIEHVARHFFARVFGLIVVPAIVYLFWFWVHFAVLTKSGTGDEFMSPAFQQTLLDSPLTALAEEIRYYDTVIIQHKGTKAFLHSHPDRYPLKYDDGRISSAGQQVTAYRFNDTNNHWIVEPTKEIPASGRGRVVRHHDIITLRHVLTNTTLLTHDVACPTMATNTEFTTWDGQCASEEECEAKTLDTHFQLDIDDAHEGQQWMTKSSHFQLVHIPTRVAMWTHTDPLLPDWAFKQQEVNGNKNLKDRTTFWAVDEIVRDPSKPDLLRPKKEPRKPTKMNFFRKFFELQVLMLQHNAGLTDSHPYATGPINWPFLLSGISFWTGGTNERQQVYLIGNVVGWWICIMALSIFVGVLAADQLANRRGLTPIPTPMRNRLYNTGGFFLLAWLYHYAPFFTMSRQLFLHHYLPAHLISALVAGVVFHFLFCGDTVDYPVSVAGPLTRRRPRTRAKVGKGMKIAFVVVVGLLVANFAFLKPLTYGTPSLTPEQVNRRRMLSSWTLHYAK